MGEHRRALGSKSAKQRTPLFDSPQYRRLLADSLGGGADGAEVAIAVTTTAAAPENRSGDGDGASQLSAARQAAVVATAEAGLGPVSVRVQFVQLKSPLHTLSRYRTDFVRECLTQCIEMSNCAVVAVCWCVRARKMIALALASAAVLPLPRRARSLALAPSFALIQLGRQNKTFFSLSATHFALVL